MWITRPPGLRSLSAEQVADLEARLDASAGERERLEHLARDGRQSIEARRDDVDHAISPYPAALHLEDGQLEHGVNHAEAYLRAIGKRARVLGTAMVVVEAADLACLTGWLDWAYAQATAA